MSRWVLVLPTESWGIFLFMEFTKEELSNEEWRDVVGYEGKYQVSNLGRVRSLNFHREKRMAILHPIIDIGGYATVKLCLKGSVTLCRIHRLVAQCFIDNIEGKPFIDHIDTNRTNNRISNLRWVTMKENHNNHKSLQNHASATKKCWGDGAHDRQKKEILQFSLDGILIQKHRSIKEAGLSIGKYTSNIGMCARCPEHHYKAHGFLWCYADDTKRIAEIENLRKKSEKTQELFAN